MASFNIQPPTVAIGRIILEHVFRQSLVGIAIDGEEYLLDPNDCNLTIEVNRSEDHALRHVMIGRYLESLEPTPDRFSVFRVYVEYLETQSSEYNASPTGQYTVKDSYEADGTHLMVSYDRLTTNIPLLDQWLLNLLVDGPPPFRRSDRKLTLSPEIHKLNVPWLPHPWTGRK